MERAIHILAAVVLAMGAFHGNCMAQSVELKPIEVPRSAYSPTADQANEHVKLREEFRRTYWADEARRIAQFGQRRDVVRDDDNLYIRIKTSDDERETLVFKNVWGVDPAARYLYLAYDDVAHFHIVSEDGHDMPRLLLTSAKTGQIYAISGLDKPIYSPDKRRFLSLGAGGLGGCSGDVAIYRFERNKPFVEGGHALGCVASCSFEWRHQTEVRGECRNGASQEGGKVNYRLTFHDGRWLSTRTPVAK